MRYMRPPREIKFRAWDGTKMLQQEDFIAEIFHMGYDVQIKDTSAWDAVKYLRNPKAVLMQYTGLLDQHGTEIYEDDMVLNRRKDHGDLVAGNVAIDPHKGVTVGGYPIGEDVDVLGNIYQMTTKEPDVDHSSEQPDTTVGGC